MTSGNFFIGRDLSIEHFTKYVIPELTQRGCTVYDKMAVHDTHGTTILTSISTLGEKNLETILDDALVQSGRNIPDQQNAPSQKHFSAYHVSESHYQKQEGKNVNVYTGIYTVIGVYTDEKTATQLFQLIAQKYVAQETKEEIAKLEQKIKRVALRLSGEKEK